MEKQQQNNFEYLCRVCAANTKGKNSVAECVYILKTPALKDKIEKYLYLSISENDVLPKVLCKTCFRQVESTASLSKIAKHTQHVFRDFLFSTKAKPHSADINYDNDPNASEYTPMSLTAKEAPKSHQQAVAVSEKSPPPQPKLPAPTPPAAAPTPAPVAATTAAAAATTPTTPTTTATQARKDEVIVNVSVTDPLTRETSQKMISCAAQKRQSLLNPLFTPKSIAQRAIPATKPSESIESSTKKPSPSGVINFFHGGRPQQVTTFTSGGYIIGRVSTSCLTPTTTTTTSTQASIESQNILQQKRRNLKMALSNIKAANAGQVSLLKVSQKPKPPAPTVPEPLSQDDDGLGEELPEQIIIAAAKKQKHHHQKQPQQPQPQEQAVVPPAAAAPQPSPKKHHNHKPTRTEATTAASQEGGSPPKAQSPEAITRKSGGLPEDILLGKVIKDTDLLKLILKALQWPVTKQTMDAQMLRLRNSKFAEIMSDPNLLLDTDLTQIMGPYLAPVLLAAHAMQQQQLANAAAAAAAAAQNLTQQPHAASATNTITTTTAAAAAAATLKASKAAADLANAIPYKLPAETSVQLVPASNSEEEDKDTNANVSKTVTSNAPLMAAKRDSRVSSYPRAPPRKVRRKLRGGESTSIVISDEEEVVEPAPLSAGTSRRTAKLKSSNFQVDIDPSIFSQFGICAVGGGDSSNDALLALLQRQRAALGRLQRSQRRRNSSSNVITLPASGVELGFDEDDIVLMDQGQQHFDEQISKSNSTLASSVFTNLSSIGSVASLVPSTVASTALSSFPLPAQVSSPLITRPIIKRRKTVIQASPARTTLNIGAKLVEAAATVTALTARAATNTESTTTFDAMSSVMLPPMPPLHKKPSTVSSGHTIATQVPSTVISIATQIPSKTASDLQTNSKTTATNVTSTASVATSNPSLESCTREPSPVKTYGKKSQASKSALGQQLLEAIGLQKVKSNSSSSLLADDTSKSLSETSSSRESVQQIRSALKRSLKQAQEQQHQHQQQQQQQQRKHGLLIIQDADSTTKSVVKEVLVEAKTKHSSSNASPADIDVEDEIDKIALVVQKNPSEPKRSEKVVVVVAEKKEEKRLCASKIPAPAMLSPEMRRKPPSQLNRSRKSPSLLLEAKNASSELNTIEEVREDSDSKPEKEKDMHKSDDSLNLSTSFVTDTSEASTIKVVPRKRGRKSKADLEAEAKEREKEDKRNDIVRQRTFEKARSRSAVSGTRKSTSDRDWERDSDTMSVKNDGDLNTSSNRPTRVSKTLSRYYKGPDQQMPARRSIPTRSTRNRK